MVLFYYALLFVTDQFCHRIHKCTWPKPFLRTPCIDILGNMLQPTLPLRKKWCQSNAFPSKCNIIARTLAWSRIASDSKNYFSLDHLPLKSPPSNQGNSILKSLPMVSTILARDDKPKCPTSVTGDNIKGSLVEIPKDCPTKIPLPLSCCTLRVATDDDCPKYYSNIPFNS